MEIEPDVLARSVANAPVQMVSNVCGLVIAIAPIVVDTQMSFFPIMVSIATGVIELGRNVWASKWQRTVSI